MIDNMSIITVQNLVKQFIRFKSQKDLFLHFSGLRKIRTSEKKDIFTALNDINFSITKGEKVAIIGRNGAGKTTLLKILTGFLQPTEGKVTIRGALTALLSISNGVNLYLSGYENIKKTSLLYDIDNKQLDTYINDIIDFSELHNVIHEPVYTYSLGMKMRLEFAMATAIQSNIILLDEVLGAGDGYFMQKSRKRLESILGENCTMILVTHSMQEVKNLCSRAIMLNKGRILKDAIPDDVIPLYLSVSNKEKNNSHCPQSEGSWLYREHSERPYFLTKRVNHLEASLNKIVLQDTILDGRKIMVNKDKESCTLKSFNCFYKPTNKTLLLAGDEFKCKIILNSKATEHASHLILRFYDNNCLCVGSFDHSLNNLSSETINLILSPIIFGSGDYQICLGIYRYDKKLLELYPNIYTFSVDYANEYDTPMYHIPGKWDFGEENASEARISAYQ